MMKRDHQSLFRTSLERLVTVRSLFLKFKPSDIAERIANADILQDLDYSSALAQEKRVTHSIPVDLIRGEKV